MKQVLGFDFGGTKVDIGVADADGTLIRSTRLGVSAYTDADTLLGAALRAGQALSAGEPVAAVGVSTMGITHDDHVDLAPNVPGWGALQLPQSFRGAFPSTPVAIENDVRAACLAEFTWGSLVTASCAAFLNLGTGIALAFILDGQLYRGAHGAAGEIAYLWKRQEKGFAAGRAPFEENYGGGGLDRIVTRDFPPYRSFSALFDHLDDTRVTAFLVETFQEIARRVGHVLLAYDVECVAVGGGIARQFDWFAPILDAEWAEHLPFPPKLVPAHFADQAGLYGALALACRPEVLS